MKRLLIVSVLLLASLNTSLSSAYDRVTYIHSNGQGTPVAASDEQGGLEWRAEYYPFGEEFSNTEVRRENDISYSGKPLDQEIGLIYFGARHYDPQVGRFTSIDPAQATAHNYLSFNRYAYANNNPYKYVDPNGEFPLLIPVAIFIGKEIAAEIASRATDGATDFLSIRRLGTNAATQVVKIGENIKAAKRGAEGASGSVKTPKGNTFLGNSTGSSATGGSPRAPTNPQVQEALDNVENPSRSHGACCEIDAFNKALNAGDSLKGAKMGTVTLNKSGRVLGACSTCREVKKALGVE